MKNVLILEDSKVRVEAFRKNFKNANMTFTEDVNECIEFLKNNKYDYIFLDHDLGGQVFTNSDEKSGFCVAKWLSENPENTPNSICLHTLNPIGQRNMLSVLPNAIMAPFCWNRATILA